MLTLSNTAAGSPREPAPARPAALVPGEPAQRRGSAEAAARAARLRENIVRLVALRGTNLGRLARCCGMPSANGLYNFLGGKSCSLSMATLQRLAPALGVSVDQLLGPRAALSPEGPAGDREVAAGPTPEALIALQRLADSLDALHGSLTATAAIVAAAREALASAAPPR